MISKRIVAWQLLEIRTVNQRFLDVPVFGRSMPGIGSTLEHCGKQSAGRVSEFSGHAGSKQLHFLQRINRRRRNLVCRPDHGSNRLFTADSVQRVADGSLTLSDDMLSIDVRCRRQIEQNTEGVFL